MPASGPRLSLALALSTMLGTLSLTAQQPEERPVFRAAVDLVSVAVVVRDKQGRVVSSLSREDFSVTDGGEPRRIVDFQADAGAPIGVALLVDSSGSMPRDAVVARRISERLLDQLSGGRDEAALMSFDTRLLKLRPFTSDLVAVRRGLAELDPFGASSIYDAIAGGAGHVADGTRKRRALVVVTDGADNASVHSPEEVAWIASTIDVPVYVLAVDAAAVDPEARHAARAGVLGELARATGGDYFVAGTTTAQQIAIGRIVEELRHQYLLVFEPSNAAGLRRLDIQTRNAAAKVRARRWYSGDTSE